MNAQTGFTHAQVEPGRAAVERAAAWYVLLQSSEASAEDRAACECWRADNPTHELAWQRIRALCGDFEPVRATAARTAVEAALMVPRRRRVKRSGVALSLALLAGLGMALQRDWFADYRTDNFTARAFALPDHSVITLDAGSAADVVFEAGQRRVVLRRGEILVEVAHDSQRPFVVETPEGSARALGTRYLVERDAGSTRVTVLESSVRVCAAADGVDCVDLRPGEQVDVSRRALGSVARVDTDAAVAWQRNRLAVDDAPVAEVLAALQRHRAGRIHFNAADLADVRVSGVFPLDDTDRALEVLANTLSLRVDRYTSLLVVVAPR
jgi:transmembrane sensor